MAQLKSRGDDIFDYQIEMSNNSSGDVSSNPFEFSTRAVNSYCIDRPAEGREKIMAWISNFISSHPDGLKGNCSYVLPTPTACPIKMDEQEFPALPLAPKETPLPQTPLNYSKLKAPNPSNSRSSQTSKFIRNDAIDRDEAVIPHEKNEIGREDSKVVDDRTPARFNTRPLPAAPWPKPQNTHAISTNECQGGRGRANNFDDLGQMVALVDKQASETSHGSWRECRCDKCYQDSKEEYEKHMQDCEDCREEYFNHTLFDGELEKFWIRLERKLGNGEAICRLCRWKRDLAKHPFERARAPSSKNCA
jgi:hypothetical protein